MAQENNATARALASLQRGESCAFLQPDNMTGCRAPRSCHSCLDMAGCMINTSGQCVSQLDEVYDPALGYERALADGFALPNATASSTSQQQWLFPAGRVTYCATSDAVARTCRRANFWHVSAADSRFCLGESGTCVCIDVCERPPLAAARADCSSTRRATPAPSSPVASGSTSDDRRDWEALVGATIFGVVVLGFLLRARRVVQTDNTSNTNGHVGRRHQQPVRRERNEAPGVSRGVDHLNLNGWETHRRDLIAKEAAAQERTDNGPLVISDPAPTSGEREQHGDDDSDRRTMYTRVQDAADSNRRGATARSS